MLRLPRMREVAAVSRGRSTRVGPLRSSALSSATAPRRARSSSISRATVRLISIRARPRPIRHRSIRSRCALPRPIPGTAVAYVARAMPVCTLAQRPALRHRGLDHSAIFARGRCGRGRRNRTRACARAGAFSGARRLFRRRRDRGLGRGAAQRCRVAGHHRGAARYRGLDAPSRSIAADGIALAARRCGGGGMCGSVDFAGERDATVPVETIRGAVALLQPRRAAGRRSGVR